LKTRTDARTEAQKEDVFGENPIYGIAVTVLCVSTKLLYAEPGYDWDG